MSKEKILERLAASIIQGESTEAKEAAQQALDAGISPIEAVMEMQRAMGVVGEKRKAGEYFLPELMISGKAMNSALEIIEPHMKPEEIPIKGKVVMGTVEDDLHDIGKNVVIMTLKAGGFEVYDLGKDVPAADFVEKIEEVDPDIVALSALMSTTLPNMERTISTLREAGVRDKIKIMIGGAPVQQMGDALVDRFGADAYGYDEIEALEVAKNLVQEA